MGINENDDGFKKLCNAIIIMAAKDYHLNKPLRASINRFVRSEWFKQVVEGSEYPNMTPELFWEIGNNKNIKSVKCVEWNKESKGVVVDGQIVRIEK